jgi:hypothetical protein
MYLEKSLNSSSTNFAFVFIVYIFTFALTAIMPISILLVVFAFALKNSFLALRIAIISTVALINNQFILSGITNYFYEQKSLHVYVIGILFYFILFWILKFFSKITFTKELKFFIFLTIIIFFMSYQNIFKSIQFLFNVVGGFLGLFILINALLKNFNYNNIQKFKTLEKDFFYIILLIMFLSFAIIIIDLTTNFAYLQAQAQALSSLRGDGEVKLLNGIPKQYTTGFLGLDFLVRYTSLINDPLRGAYWYLYLSLFLIGMEVNQNIKIIMIFILFLFLINCWSKGVMLSMFFISIFYFLYRYKLYKFSIIFFISIIILFIYLSGILKTSAVIHVLGLLLPFQSDININYFLGHDFFQAGNMGRIDGEHWMDSVARGAESLVGTYMYAYGILGVFLYMKIHYKTIKLLNRFKMYLVASIITVGLFVSFLQEGQYNVLQVFSMYLLIFFLIGRNKFKDKSYDN